MSFSKNFLWGGDISAAQCEGAWNEDGRGPVEMDFMTCGTAKGLRELTYQMPDGSYGRKKVMISGKLPKDAKYACIDGENYINHRGIDFYHHYKEDIAYFAEMGFKALNLTISWARIYPQGYKKGINTKGVEFYRNVLEECRKYDIEPIVTLYKYDMPVYYIENMGGWSNRELIDEFVEFARVCFTEYKNLVKYWITFNEINMLLLSSKFAETKPDTECFTELHNQLLASAKAVSLAHAISPDYFVGSMNCGFFPYPLTCDPLDVINCQRESQTMFYYTSDVQARGYYPSYSKRIWEKYGVDMQISDADRQILKDGKVDYFAFSYYQTNCITTHTDETETVAGNLSKGAKNPYLKASEWGWQIDPEGLKYALHEIYDRYQMPLMIVENGMGANDILESDGTIHDPYHIEYLKEHIKKMKEAVNEGVDLIGYTMWSCIDLCAASTGQISKRYGFIYVDVDNDGNGTYKRYKKDSFYWYQKVIRSNGEDLA
jgi:6-phospho-beta-glucosidase